MSKPTHKIIILGSGPAGLTAALYTARAQLAPLVAEGPQPGGQLTITTEVENYPGFPKGILGPELMNAMREQVRRFGAEIIQRRASRIDLNSKPLRVWFDDEEFCTEALIIATGASAKTLGLPQEKTLMGYGLSTCATCDGAFFRDQEIIVIGGGDSACEEALFLTRFGKRVRIVLRRDEFRASKIMSKRVLEHPKIEVIYNSLPVELLGTVETGLTGLILENAIDKSRTTLQCNGVFYAIGHTPNTDLFKGALKMDQNGYLITMPDSTKTAIEGVFACGDVQDHIFRQAVTAAGSGCMAAIEAERWLAERE